MKIQRIEFRNFRTFRSFDFDIGGRSLFVIGENAGGKTSLLTGIARALGRDLSFTSADFTDLSQPIELRATVSDLDPSQRGVFGNYAEFGSDNPRVQLQVRAVWNPAAEEAETEHGYPRHPGSRSRRVERDAIPLQWLPSTRDPGRMLQFGVARNLMSRLLETLPLETGVDQAINALRQASQQLGQDVALDDFLVAARDSLSRLLPDVASKVFSMGISAVTPYDLLRQFELIVEHLGEPIAVARQSSGLAQLSIFVFATMLASRDPGAILLIDEPEISLHPQSQRALMRALRALKSQMLVATHSANLLDRTDPRTIVRLRRSIGGIEIASPSGLTDVEARRLGRFTSTQTAEAFFARKVVLVEGLSDQLALEVLAERRGRNLDAEGLAIVPIGGARTIGRYLELLGPHGFRLQLSGLCDEAEEGDFARGLDQVGLGANLTRADMERLGFYVCVADLEDELIRALGVQAVEAIVDAHGDSQVFQVFRKQPTYRGLAPQEQLRAFVSTHGRKVEYVPLLVDALDLSDVPERLDRVLADA
jgi:predicted ATPase